MDNNQLIIRTYPFEITAFCAIVAVSSIAGLLFGKTDIVGIIFGISIPLIVLILVEFKKVEFNKITKSMALTTHRLLQTKKLNIPISEIKDFKIIRGKGGFLHKGYIEASTSNGNHSITSMGSTNPERQNELMKEIKEFLNIQIEA